MINPRNFIFFCARNCFGEDGMSAKCRARSRFLGPEYIGIVQKVFSPKGVPRIFDAFWNVPLFQKNKTNFGAFLTHFRCISDVFLTHSCYCRRLFREHLLGRYRISGTKQESEPEPFTFSRTETGTVLSP